MKNDESPSPNTRLKLLIITNRHSGYEQTGARLVQISRQRQLGRVGLVDRLVRLHFTG